MDKQVKFKIKIDTDGAEKVHKVSVDAVDLAENINKVTKAQSELNSEMVNINQLKQSWDNLYQGCQQVAGIVGELTAAYNTQEQPREQLTTEEIKRRYREAMRKWKGTYNSSPQMTQAEKRHTPQQKIKR